MTNMGKWQFYTENVPAPEHFIRWNYYFMVSAALGRKIWWGEGDYLTYPNQYVFFVGFSGVGKSIVPSNSVKPLLEQMKLYEKDPKGGPPIEKKLVHLAATSTTLERLFDDMCAVTERIQAPDGRNYAHTSMTFMIPEEAGSLFRKNTEDLVTFLTEAWNCKDFQRNIKSERHPIRIKNMCLNLLCCCTPEWVTRNLTTALISEGFAGRVLFIWGDDPNRIVPVIRFSAEQEQAKDSILDWLKHLAGLFGPVVPTKEAYKWFEDWCYNRMKVKLNKFKQCDKYYGRVKTHLTKLAMAVHFSEKSTMQIDAEDFAIAEKELRFIELNMHRALCGGGRNPLALLAEDILHDLQGGPMTYKQLLLAHYNGGNREDIENAISWLGLTDQISPNVVTPGATYNLTRRV